jgi:hypothetical protein
MAVVVADHLLREEAAPEALGGRVEAAKAEITTRRAQMGPRMLAAVVVAEAT